MLRLNHVTWSRQGQSVLDAVTLEVRQGELVVVEGGRGAGKSSLLEIAGARRRPDRGGIWIAGHDLTTLQRDSLPFVRRNIGFCGSEPRLLAGLSVLDNVMLAMAARAEAPTAAREAALRALGKVGMAGLATARAETLSTATRRLAAIARALAGAPPLVLLDDPSTFLTPADTGGVLSALLGAAENGAAALCVSSDAAFVAAATRAGGRRLRLENGRLQTGTVAMSVVAGGRSGDALAVREALASRREALP